MAVPQHPFDRTDERGTDGSAGEAGDKRDDRDRAEIHPLLRRARCLVGLDRGGGWLRVRQMPCQWARGGAPFGAGVRRAHRRSAEMALRADHAERDHERDKRAGDAAGNRRDDDRAVEDVHLSIHPVENFANALRRHPDSGEDRRADSVLGRDR